MGPGWGNKLDWRTGVSPDQPDATPNLDYLLRAPLSPVPSLGSGVKSTPTPSPIQIAFLSHFG